MQSRVVFNPDCTETQRRLVRELESLLRHDRGDSVEERIVSRPLADSEECTIYVIVNTDNIVDLVAKLIEWGLFDAYDVL